MLNSADGTHSAHSFARWQRGQNEPKEKDHHQHKKEIRFGKEIGREKDDSETGNFKKDKKENPSKFDNAADRRRCRLERISSNVREIH